MINEIYISMAFAVCINTSNMSLATPSLAFNTIYAAVMGIVLVGWPIFVTIKFALALKNMPQLKLQSLIPQNSIDMQEGGEKE